MRTLIGHSSAGVPESMEGEHKPVITVDEFRVDFVFHVVGLAAELRAHITDLLESIEWSPERDLAGLGLPLPRLGDIHSRELYVKGITDRFDLPQRVETIRFGDLFENWRAGQRSGSC